MDSKIFEQPYLVNQPMNRGQTDTIVNRGGPYTHLKLISLSSDGYQKHSVDSVASYSSQNHVDRIRTQNFSAASCQDDSDFNSIKSNNFRRSTSNLEFPHRRPDSVISNSSSTRSRLRELVERKADEHKVPTNAVGDIQYFDNPTETLEFDTQRSAQDKKTNEERPKKRKLTKTKGKDKEQCEHKPKKQEKYQSKLAEYYKLPVQLPQDEFYQHLTKSRAAEDSNQRRFANSDTEFNGSYGRLCKHKEPEGSNLRRSRSLAVIREETFTDLQIQNHGKAKRSQLIPRARLFDKPCFKDRLPGRAKYQTKEEVLEGIYIDSTASCFGDINGQPDSIENKHKLTEREEVASQVGSTHSRSVSGSWPNLTEDISKHANVSEDSIGHSRNPSEIDSLDSNYVRKHYNFEAHLKNHRDSTPDTERSALTPESNNNIYIDTYEKEPDQDGKNKSKNIENAYISDNVSIYRSDSTTADYSPIQNGDHLIAYDEVSINSKHSENKIYTRDTQADSNGTNEISKESDIRSLVSDHDDTVSSPPDSITSYISISIPSSTEKSHKLEYLANSLAEKIDEYCGSQYKDVLDIPNKHNKESDEAQILDPDPIYTKINKKRESAEIHGDKYCSKPSLINETVKKSNNDIYISNTYIECDDIPKQTYQFCTSSKNITTEPFVTTLIENQYYSLPDINISKCLRKSERIDAQLREEDPEDIPCENTYEIAHSHFRDILTSKANQNYGQLNTIHVKYNNTSQPNSHTYLTEYSEPHLIQNFTRLEDDLKSIITVNSSNLDEVDINDYNHVDTQQNERELNEIEGTIRNNKIIIKSESSKAELNSAIHIPEQKSSTYVNNKIQDQSNEVKKRTGIKKHYSLRQREPNDNDIELLPSPDTVKRCVIKNCESSGKTFIDTDSIKTNSLLSRVQSFKTSADSNITIVPLSGHQTIVIDAPITHDSDSPKDFHILDKHNSDSSNKEIEKVKNKPPQQPIQNKTETEKQTIVHTIDTSTYTAKEPFITIKLNKVVKTIVPKLRSDKIAAAQHTFEKPPPRLIIKDESKCFKSAIKNIASKKMTRPQVLQIIDSHKNKQNENTENNNHEKVNKSSVSMKIDVCSNKESTDTKSDVLNVKEKINNAIKTDIEYQEKLHSVKNYWSKLIDQKCENKNDNNQENKIYSVIKEKNSTENITNEDGKSISETSVGDIVKSMESVKIVDSIRKVSQTKLHLWKDESEKVKDDSEIEETTVKKIVKECENNSVHEKYSVKPDSTKRTELDLCTRDTPEIEIVELSSNDNQNKKTQATLIKAKGYEQGCDEFDHVRYKVMKSELFKNSMIANYRKEAQFDGLLQYLQDYSFQELLVNNNIVIIEPVRTKIEPAPRKNTNTDTSKISPSLLKKNDSNSIQTEKSKNAVRKHFFYHPIRVNKEIIEEELPNPDTVKKVRNLFEDTLKMKTPMTHDPPLVDELGLTRRATSYRNLIEDNKLNKIGCRKKIIRQLTIDTSFGNKKWDNASLSSGVSSGDLSSNNEYETDGLSPFPHKNLKDNVYSSSDEYLCDSISHDFCCETQYISPDVLKKIRECGTSITYYGGKVLNSKVGPIVSPMTKAIMEEIKGLQKNCSRDCYSCQTKCLGDTCSCLMSNKHRQKANENKSYSTSSSNNSNQNLEDKNRHESFPGFKFKLVKSNSCSSRLELTGTDDSKNSRVKFRKPQCRADDPPLLNDEENSVKNKISRLESYSKGIAKTPFDTKDQENNKIMFKIKNDLYTSEVKVLNNDNNLEQNLNNVGTAKKLNIATILPTIIQDQDPDDTKSKEESVQTDKTILDPHSFEKKYYYVNDTTETKTTHEKFGEMVFEEFEVLESCYDSLNSNKSSK